MVPFLLYLFINKINMITKKFKRAEHLWLDDARDPMNYIGNEDYCWVKSYDEFVEYINEYGLPWHIHLDHDLGPGKNGCDAMKYVAQYCLDYMLDLPAIHIHTNNPAGRINIEGVIHDYERQVEEFDQFVENLHKENDKDTDK